MPLEGVEPPLTCVNMDLNHARLPIPPQRLELVILSAHHATSQAAKQPCSLFVVRCPWFVDLGELQLTTDDGQRTPTKKTAAAESLGRGGCMKQLSTRRAITAVPLRDQR